MPTGTTTALHDLYLHYTNYILAGQQDMVITNLLITGLRLWFAFNFDEGEFIIGTGHEIL